jgi:hypothetical protein
MAKQAAAFAKKNHIQDQASAEQAPPLPGEKPTTIPAKAK